MKQILKATETRLLIAFNAILLFINSSCSKFLEVPPPVTSIVETTVFENDATAAAVLTNLYVNISNVPSIGSDGTLASVIHYGSLCADETRASPNNLEFMSLYSNSYDAGFSPLGSYWNKLYNVIYVCNAAVKGCSNSEELTTLVKHQLLGEAYFMRAFAYFYLVNLFGDVPLISSTDYKINSVLERSQESKIYEQIVEDLRNASLLLTDDYKGGNAKGIVTERLRPNKSAAQAMLSRVYLYRKEYLQAEHYADTVIGKSTQYYLEPIDRVFLIDSKEAIWQLSSVSSYNVNTMEARTFLPSENPLGVTSFLDNAFVGSFLAEDKRKSHWVKFGDDVVNGNIYYPYKYRLGSLDGLGEYSVVLRLAEMYLIRAEARAFNNDLDGARKDLDLIRQRAGLPDIFAAGKQELVDSIAKERHFELFTEWGHRFFDLKRLGKLNDVLSVSKPEHWKSRCEYFPIPALEIKANPRLTQNPGYN